MRIKQNLQSEEIERLSEECGMYPEDFVGLLDSWNNITHDGCLFFEDNEYAYLYVKDVCISCHRCDTREQALEWAAKLWITLCLDYESNKVKPC